MENKTQKTKSTKKKLKIFEKKKSIKLKQKTNLHQIKITMTSRVACYHAQRKTTSINVKEGCDLEKKSTIFQQKTFSLHITSDILCY